MNNNLNSINPNSKIGKNVIVESFTKIYGDVVIGDNTWIGPNVTIMSGARIGNNCKIFPGSVISGIPQDLKFKGEDSIVIIGNNTIIRECVTINRGTKALGKTIIGNNCLLMAYSHIAHDCIIRNNCIIANGVAMGGHVIINDFGIIGGLSAIHQFVKIGSHSMISGGSLVRKDIPPFIKVAHEPLRYTGINNIGLKRRGFNNDDINEIKNIYRIIYQSNLNTSQAIKYINSNLNNSKFSNLIIDFIMSSTRGIVKSIKT
ncbi:MAG: acyl-ACP--UDP-N-acetylglucosamine O-acyltransferase [Flavobacteriales bacterium TMED288]|nr:acyl-[acyl-carrier-protein]--UDP-N-acetylglucosamine O-acyltransferase [Flavobacteriales bacterium]RPG53485.1 MAG: acyl-ACP--UDP-N-acetylglucosamine O-acyltransferase [Flavobacteriales bacterium TMED288]|tara:strand:- start:899 stop:1678 length:780 start_codon:yes stop_codon:yes gene_type:complete